MKRFFLTILSGLALWPGLSARAEEQGTSCDAADRACLIGELEAAVKAIAEPKWRDISYRELAKLLTADGQPFAALPLLEKIENADTRALAIRGIAMGSAPLKLESEKARELFDRLIKVSESIPEKGSGEIALTYVSMGMALGGDNRGAIEVANRIATPALRHKALGEAGEINAERKDEKSALMMLSLIEDQAYRNKSSRTITLLLADRGLYAAAYQAAHAITNPTLKAEALQYLLEKQKPPASLTHGGETP